MFLYIYELEFPPTIKYHYIQYVSLLDPTSNDPLPGQHNSPLLPLIVDQEDEYYIEEVLNSCMFRK